VEWRANGEPRVASGNIYSRWRVARDCNICTYFSHNLGPSTTTYFYCLLGNPLPCVHVDASL
jgi:hypothetical protein